MGLLGPSRRDYKGDDPHLDAKIFLFLGGAALAMAGIALDRPTLVWLAFLPLGIGFLLRFFRPRE